MRQIPNDARLRARAALRALDPLPCEIPDPQEMYARLLNRLSAGSDVRDLGVAVRLVHGVPIDRRIKLPAPGRPLLHSSRNVPT